MPNSQMRLGPLWRFQLRGRDLQEPARTQKFYGSEPRSLPCHPLGEEPIRLHHRSHLTGTWLSKFADPEN